MNKTAIFSFFSGAGFLDLGFEDNGFDICFVNELDSTFMEAYKFSRKSMGKKSPTYGTHMNSAAHFLNDKKYANKLRGFIKDAYKFHNLVGFIAGPPCPDFSVAGKNRGSEGPHGQLSSTYIDLVIKQKPDFFVFENVKGLWSTAKHREFYNGLINRLEKSGYTTTHRLINALECGVPQNRERIILIGFKKDLKPKDGDMYPWDAFIKYRREDVLGQNWPETSDFIEDSILEMPKNIYLDLTCEYWFNKNDVYNHPNSKHFFTPHAINRFRTIKEGDVRGKSFKRLHRWRYSPTCAYGNNEVHLHPYKARRLSVAEALAIQSLPPSFAFPQDFTLTAMFKVIGNGVPYQLAFNIARSLNYYLNESTASDFVTGEVSIKSVLET